MVNQEESAVGSAACGVASEEGEARGDGGRRRYRGSGTGGSLVLGRSDGQDGDSSEGLTLLVSLLRVRAILVAECSVLLLYTSMHRIGSGIISDVVLVSDFEISLLTIGLALPIHHLGAIPKTEFDAEIPGVPMNYPMSHNRPT